MELFQHQKEALEKFKDKDEIALFFEMGCGKTCTALKILEWKFQHQGLTHALVIAPNDVHKQWAIEEVPKWLTVPYTIECFGGRGGLKDFYDWTELDKLNIVCVNVDTFSTPTKWQVVAEWAVKYKAAIILDEATCIKNVDSKRTQRILYAFNDIMRRGKNVIASKKICPVRIVLTGTPVTNGPMDLWSIMEFVKPNFFGENWWSFKQHYGMFTHMSIAGPMGSREIQVPMNEKTWYGIKNCSDYATAFNIFGCTQDTYFTVQSQNKYQGPYKHAEIIKDMLQEASIFKKLTDCIDMPEKIYIIRQLEMNSEQQKAYRQMQDLQMTEYQGHIATALNKLTMAMRLQQISSGFIVDKSYVTEFTDESFDTEQDLLPDEVIWLGKSNPKLDALMRDVDESDKPVIILTRYTAEAAKIYDLLKDTYDTMLYTGWKKTGTIEDFKSGSFEVLVANIACIARGFNLQVSHTILFYSNSFSMELRQQSEFRTFRAGQHNNCKYVDYCFHGTVDDDIMAALKFKLSMLEYFRKKDMEKIIKNEV